MDEKKVNLIDFIKYTKISCPDYGEIEILPHISAGMMSEISREKEDPRFIFKKFTLSSLKEKDFDLSKFSKKDWVFLGNYFLDLTNEGLEHFSGPEASTDDFFFEFLKRFKSTKLWEDHVRHCEEMRKYFFGFEDSLKSIRQELFPVENLVSSLDSFHGALSSFKTFSAFDVSGLSRFSGITGFEIGLVKSFKSREALFSTAADTLETLRGLVQHPANALLEASKSLSISTSTFRLFEDSLSASRQLVTQVNKAFSETRNLDFYIEEIKKSQTLCKLPGFVDLAEQNPEENLLFVQTNKIIQTQNSEILQLRQDVDDLKEYIKGFPRLFERLRFFENPVDFLDLMDGFSKFISRSHWESFWVTPGDNFKENPESIAKLALGSFLEGRFGGLAFVGNEIGSGNGFVDILVSFLGVSYLLELKMLGASWPYSWARTGFKQVDSYMKFYQCPVAFLVVFDGRKTDRGQDFPEYEDLENGRVYFIKIPIFFKDRK